MPTTGITRRHSTGCPALSDGRCKCNAGWEASIFSPRDKKKLRKRFPREAEAKSWRADAKRAIDHGTLRAPTATTLRDAAEAWLAGAEAGSILNRSGQPYKPSTLRGYRRSLEEDVLPVFGNWKQSAIATADLQALVDKWQGEGTPANTIRNRIKPLQAIYRRARSREGLPVNPTQGLELPAPREKEVEIVPPGLATQLLDAVPVEDQAIWGTALFAGLRHAELRALRWGAVDTATGTIDVRESWDPKEGPIPPKTRTSRRTVPMPGLLRDYLLDHRLRRGEPASNVLVFGVADKVPFQAEGLYRRADAAWKKGKLAGRLRLHQARHTYASFMIGAGVNPKALSTFMGHASISITFDRYGHLLPGSEAEAAALLDTYLTAQIESAEEAARKADGASEIDAAGTRSGTQTGKTA